MWKLKSDWSAATRGFRSQCPGRGGRMWGSLLGSLWLRLGVRLSGHPGPRGPGEQCPEPTRRKDQASASAFLLSLSHRVRSRPP